MDIVTYALLNGKIKDYASNVDEWLEENVDPATGYVLDRSLQMENAAAPADMVGDINDDVGDLKNTLNHKADVIYDTASGDIASFPDGADGLPVKDLTVSIEPVQSGSGDPSPTNVRPISGWTGCNVTRTGVNIWDEEWELGTLNTSTGEKVVSSSWIRSKNFVRVEPGKTYSVVKSDLSSSKSIFIVYYAVEDTTTSVGNYFRIQANGDTFTAPYNSNYLLFTINQTTYSNDISINSIPADTSYHASHVQTIPISWQSSAGTVYAASLDALAGLLKVRPYYASYNGETLVGPWISSMDAYTPGGTPTTGAQVVDFGGSETSYSLDAIALNTLLGQNNIWVDAGDSTVEYPCDTKLYIQKINTPTDDDMIADAQIASGKYFIVNNNLYISTAAILAGDPIKPGTNCTLTNLAAALNAINS